MRLIDADALAEEFWRIRWNLQMMDDTQTADKMMVGLRKAEIKLEDAPTIDPVKWIPCKERLPEKEYEVLVTTSWHDVCIAWYDDGKWRAEYINEYDDDEILAWKPKPEPWKGEEE